ncbi:hypothetical protein PIB30_039262 [Stylosanthes scabra]|uniref:Uncharacterized protein n=1 Tax=Stylosanthes scabra TaxID=79078 RepID=A0ABU6VCF8_9FABA|nr:hypothetical protein [Stylosanthes scabra]
MWRSNQLASRNHCGDRRCGSVQDARSLKQRRGVHSLTLTTNKEVKRFMGWPTDANKKADPPAPAPAPAPAPRSPLFLTSRHSRNLVDEDDVIYGQSSTLLLGPFKSPSTPTPLILGDN